jgi:hypothetical protein
LIRSISEATIGLSFDRLLKRVNEQDKKTCTNTVGVIFINTNYQLYCKYVNVAHQYLFNQPKVFTIGLAWDTACPSIQDIDSILDIIDEDVDIKQMFEGPIPNSKYKLKGMICYYGKHYDAYFRNGSYWWVFDDATVKEVSRNWDDVRKRCCKGRFQPSILFYELQVHASSTIVNFQNTATSADVRTYPSVTIADELPPLKASVEKQITPFNTQTKEGSSKEKPISSTRSTQERLGNRNPYTLENKLVYRNQKLTGDNEHHANTLQSPSRTSQPFPTTATSQFLPPSAYEKINQTHKG